MNEEIKAAAYALREEMEGPKNVPDPAHYDTMQELVAALGGTAKVRTIGAANTALYVAALMLQRST